MSRIKDKIKEIELFLDELSEISPPSFEDYKSSLEKKAACERYIEKIVEAATDLAFFVIKEKRLDIPKDDLDAFNILLKNNIVSEGLAAKLKSAKGMRNILAHQYGAIDDEIIFNSIKEELGRDITDKLGGSLYDSGSGKRAVRAGYSGLVDKTASAGYAATSGAASAGYSAGSLSFSTSYGNSSGGAGYTGENQSGYMSGLSVNY